MALYYFDVHDDNVQLDEVGTEFSSLDDVRVEALRLLPDLARDQGVTDGERRTFTVLVTDEDHRPVYSATLSLIGLWLIR